MVAMRVTHQMLVTTNLSNLQRGMSRLAAAQNAVSSGRQINKPSDDPAGTSQAMQLRDRLATEARYKKSAQDGIGWLSQADATMQSMMSTTQRVRDLAVRGLSNGAMSDTDRVALAKEVEGLRDALLGQVNSTYNGRPVFGGATKGSEAFATAGTPVPLVVDGEAILDSDGNPVMTVEYAGDSGSTKRIVGDGLTEDVTLVGDDVFSDDAGTTNIFDLLARMADHIQGTAPTDHDKLGADLAKLDDIMSNMRAAQAEVGTRYNKLEAVISTADLNYASLTNTLIDTENVDIATASIELASAEVAYQASMAATAKVIQPSLASFLR
jgi:flagellar hook-associated protein 3 FlgL